MGGAERKRIEKDRELCWKGGNRKFGEAAKGGEREGYKDSHLQLILQCVCVFVHQWHHKLQCVCVCWQAVCAHPSMCQA